MESKDFEMILNSMPETGVYVIREDNHRLLYFNKKVQATSPEARLGMICTKVWTGSCINCPLLAIKDNQVSRSFNYNASFGGVVDMIATRMLWEDTIPAFVVTVTPRVEAAGYTYRKILRLNLTQNRYDVLKSTTGAWFSEDGREDLTTEFEDFARSGNVHPEDVERFVAFTDIEHLQNVLRSQKTMVTCTYRRKQGNDFRWNLLEVIRAFDYSEKNQAAILCVKDVHDTMGDSLEQEEENARNRDALLTVGEQSFRIYAIDLDSGTVDLIRAEGQESKVQSDQPLFWDSFMHSQIIEKLHPVYREAFQVKFSQDGLRQAREAGEEEQELLCQWKSGEIYRYISVTARPNREYGDNPQIILSLEDMDEQIRRELTLSRHDRQMAAIFKSRFSMMTTVNLENGQCERIFLNDQSKAGSSFIGDYNYHLQQAIPQFVHPEDSVNYASMLSLKHLRENAQTAENYAEEICQYRTRENPPRWIEQHIVYSRQNGKIVVNILGHDITNEKSKEDERLRVLQDRAYIISSLTRLFFSTYYIDVEQDTFRAVTQLSRVGDVLGSEVNYTAALRIYAENFIHPDDQADFLSIMSLSNLLESLRWWQPYVTATYRKMPDGLSQNATDYQWVRATVVLAQIGANDYPKTAVFVAQDMTESIQRQTL